MTKNLKNPDEVYQDLLKHVLELLEDEYPFEMVAASLMAIAQRLYRTNLSDEDYKRLMKVAYETNVEPYDIKKGTLH
tara:strand:- start:436 stop:666 length:231 start_codon:yes stop_codon:yes gene_type:complete